jgi:hypothetical protein
MIDGPRQDRENGKPMRAIKQYIGDSVYAEFDGCGITLTTENGGAPTTCAMRTQTGSRPASSAPGARPVTRTFYLKGQTHEHAENEIAA